MNFGEVVVMPMGSIDSNDVTTLLGKHFHRRNIRIPIPQKDYPQSNGIGRSFSGVKRLKEALSQWLLMPLFIRNKYWIFVV